MFKVDDDSPSLNEHKSETFHTFVMTGMFLVKRARPDLKPGFRFLLSKAKLPTKQDWSKLVKVMLVMMGTMNEVLTLSANDSQHVCWHIDAAFRVHLDMRSHAGGTLSMGFRSMSSTIFNSAGPQKLSLFWGACIHNIFKQNTEYTKLF